MALTPVSPLDRTSPTFRSDVDTFFGSRIPNFVSEVNALAANLNSIAAGGAYAIPFRFTTDTGHITQGSWLCLLSPTLITFDALDARYADTTAQLSNLLSGSTSTVKAQLRICAQADPSRWFLYNVVGYTQYGAYGGATVQIVASSGTFSEGESVIAFFQRTGDKGDQGPAGTTGYQLIASYSVGAAVASINFGSVFSSDYDRYVIAIDGLVLSAPAGINARLAVAGAVDSSAKYSTVDNLGNTGTQVNVSGGYGVPAAKSFCSRTEVWNANSVGLKCVRSDCYFPNTGSGFQSGTSNGGYFGATAVSGIQIYPDSGTFTGGTVRVYGIRNA